MKRFASALAVIPAAWLALTLVTPTPISAGATDTADASIPVDPVTTLEMHTTANCVKAEANCTFTTAANLVRGCGRWPGGFVLAPPAFLSGRDV